MKLAPGRRVHPFTVVTIDGRTVEVPSAADQLVHLQFRRFAGCPICNLHLRNFARRKAELDAVGVREVVFFHSEAADMRPYQGDLPFDVVADASKTWYRRFGVESSIRAIICPKTWVSYARGVLAPIPSATFGGDEGGHLGLPADFLISGSGAIVACKYGARADDQWSFDEVVALARDFAAGRMLPRAG